MKVWQTVGKLRRGHGLVMSGEPGEPSYRVGDWTWKARGVDCGRRQDEIEAPTTLLGDPGGGYVERLGSARQARSRVDDLHALDEEPQCQPHFSDEAHGEPGNGDRGVGRQ